MVGRPLLENIFVISVVGLATITFSMYEYRAYTYFLKSYLFFDVNQDVVDTISHEREPHCLICRLRIGGELKRLT